MKNQTNGNTIKVAILDIKLQELKEQNTGEHKDMMNSMQEIKNKIDNNLITRQEVNLRFEMVNGRMNLIYAILGVVGSSLIYVLLKIVFNIRI